MYVIFNIHYEATGKPETDRSRIALWFAPTPPKHQRFRVNGAGETIIANSKELLTDDPGTKAEGTSLNDSAYSPVCKQPRINRGARLIRGRGGFFSFSRTRTTAAKTLPTLLSIQTAASKPF